MKERIYYFEKFCYRCQAYTEHKLLIKQYKCRSSLQLSCCRCKRVYKAPQKRTFNNLKDRRDIKKVYKTNNNP